MQRNQNKTQHQKHTRNPQHIKAQQAIPDLSGRKEPHSQGTKNQGFFLHGQQTSFLRAFFLRKLLKIYFMNFNFKSLFNYNEITRG